MSIKRQQIKVSTNFHNFGGGSERELPSVNSCLDTKIEGSEKTEIGQAEEQNHSLGNS